MFESSFSNYNKQNIMYALFIWQAAIPSKLYKEKKEKNSLISL
jgi:hypothetical protein